MKKAFEIFVWVFLFNLAVVTMIFGLDGIPGNSKIFTHRYQWVAALIPGGFIYDFYRSLPQ